jgi:putative protease
MNMNKPEIMAPAGGPESFLAAVAAGADAVYVGLKHFSARMQAANFSSGELARLAALARENGTKVYVAMNTLVKPGDTGALARLMERAERAVRPEAYITADLAAARVAREVGVAGELHCSTLANLTHPAGLAVAARLGFKRVVVPRELNLDEVRLMAEACPKGLDLEIFVHGALCHNVSGRCWWSSFFGGKSGLRGRCVQPCRRLYTRPSKKPHPQRVFSCMDLSLDVLTKPLLSIPQVRAWKIEGRKKGPHYVFYTVKAYQLLRDAPNDAQAKKMAQDYLDQALGRPASHSLFLPQRPFQPVNPDKDTGSGRFIGKIKKDGKKPYFEPFEPLLPGDLVRVGYEDEPGHRTLPVRKGVPKGGRLDLPYAKGAPPAPGTRVFLVDRREPELMKRIRALEARLAKMGPVEDDPEEQLFAEQAEAPVAEAAEAPPGAARPGGDSGAEKRRGARRENRLRLTMNVTRGLPGGRSGGDMGIWLTRRNHGDVPRGLARRVWWWLPPVIWPDEEATWRELARDAAKDSPAGFVLGAPWQAGLFEDDPPPLLAGPFCNVSNGGAIAELADLGFAGVIASPELARDDALALPGQSALPVGFVLSGLWPLGISRVLAEAVQLDETYHSPRKEGLFVKRYGQNNWIFPGWELDLGAQRKALERAGYTIFVHLKERWPKKAQRAERTSTFNWDNRLL